MLARCFFVGSRLSQFRYSGRKGRVLLAQRAQERIERRRFFKIYRLNSTNHQFGTECALDLH